MKGITVPDGLIIQGRVVQVFETLEDTPITLRRMALCWIGEAADLVTPDGVPHSAPWRHGERRSGAGLDEPGLNKGLTGLAPQAEQGPVEANGPIATLRLADKPDDKGGTLLGEKAGPLTSHEKFS